MTSELILVTGATGYIASRLIPRLLAQGYRVRALARHPERLAGRAWLSRVEVMAGDVTRPASFIRALEGVDSAYYLIHSMASGRGYMRIETEGARNFAEAAARAGIDHIIYLGGLADPSSPRLASHMRSRMETGEALRAGRIPATEFRAGVIVGPGSISFEMIRFLTEFFPFLPGPAWLKNRVQPIAIRNVIDYLAAALENKQARGGIYEIGGPEVMRYGEALLYYARLRGLRRSILALPALPIGLMAWFVDRLTPVPASIAAPLIGGLQSDSIVLDDSARRLFREIQLVAYEPAVREALQDLVPACLERVWEGGDHLDGRFKHEGFFVDHRRAHVAASPEVVYAVFNGLGGRYGWLYADALWRLRGRLDRLLGGPGLRGRPDALREDNLLDYYRVEALKPGRLMRLRSELRAPGEAWMEWQVEAGPAHGSVLTQTAFFAPRGLPGFMYWFLLGPLHRLVFSGLLKELVRRSERA